MSYILDALNKADKDREQNTPAKQAPNIEQTPYSPAASNHKYSMVWFALMMLLLGGWWVYSYNNTPMPAQVVAHTASAKSTTLKPKNMNPVQLQEPLKIKHVIPNIMALPAGIRSQLPPLQISAHVYSDDVSKRMVIINQRVVHEQQYVANQLQLIAIQQHGIELLWRDITFTMKVNDTWAP